MAGTVPFSVNRNDARSLVDQVADGMRQAIVSGHWRVGDELPSTRELVPLLGVSHIVTRAALSRLAAEGYVLARTGLKPVVRDRSEKQWRGRVVFVYSDFDVGYFQTILAEELCERLTKAGWLFTRNAVHTQSAGSRHDFSLLDAALASSVDLAIVLFDRPAIFRHLSAKGVPFAAVLQDNAIPRGAVGAVHFDSNAAMPDFAAACREAGIGKVVQLGYSRHMCDAAPTLQAVGIDTETVFLPLKYSRGDLDSIEDAGHRAAMRLLKSGMPGRDTLWLFTDDYLARGAITATLAAGLKAPEDFRFATWSNSGLGPAYVRELSRMEMNPPDAGRAVADAAVKYLGTGRFPEGVAIGPKWFAGGTMEVAK